MNPEKENQAEGWSYAVLIAAVLHAGLYSLTVALMHFQIL